MEGGRLNEPLPNNDFRIACPEFARGTYNSFLWKHRTRNHQGESELEAFLILPS